ncbi:MULTISPECIES: bifunctional biotin--[acetyl-CoA-carboxylase] ligase/biotin operon repressor BirA [Shewanella]|uniref:Bifunctional ligase/repressor BirA n=1 Tax=Shewanella fidelis TaxID=173509 RepID=A0AAW8NUW4_9GAMM|nr:MULTISPECIES: bifunctional biotin--[acetyl-CoA-carboxylase] ligase/biotin operon repressor BirA [Shewanella]MDR8526016.1 bifunctional biotin--[acetyl-CoA-carboxylase] ligase/biotin operon repressor BirA [Shewanella fidelis]MDW4814042.1 bifunctional biotin--[acetyl-CoA-carboxylase] ligase/biotin operon repressor BirA [Shewanella fidelis]MDW4818213.1 bifunctional biotin--[acetyl-CoA-carboxylase] ligase/biotin operon repressor BirA [Shewanella fidelis]MDW4822279.1 bifunctional biotin--[acetyl-C
MAEQWIRKREILSQLAAGSFVSGEALAALLGVSRTAVANHIAGLEEYGVDIYSVKGKGYRLNGPISLVDETKLKQQIANRCFYFDEIPSTNAFILKHAEELVSGDICVAEYQSAGRGRRGRVWVSPYGCHLYFSMFWQFPQGMAQAMGLSLVVACSIVSVLKQLGVKDVGVKWPNDIYLENRKLAGVLIEMNGQTDSECNLVIGIGLNMAMSEQHAAMIDQPWSDLVGQDAMPDKTELLVLLQKQLQRDLSVFQGSGLSAFSQRWRDADLFDGRQVKLLMGQEEVLGVCRGVDEQGAILLETDAGLQSFIGGEISLRKAD